MNPRCKQIKLFPRARKDICFKTKIKSFLKTTINTFHATADFFNVTCYAMRKAHVVNLYQQHWTLIMWLYV